MADINGVYNLLQEIYAILKPPPRPEKILDCANCSESITAYGPNGEAFVSIGNKYYHNACAPAQ